MEMAATPEQVWEGLTNSELTRRYYMGQAIDADLRPGSEYAYRWSSGEPSVAGTVLDVEPPRRLRLTATLLSDPETRTDPPHRVTWEIEPIGEDRSRVRLALDDFASETATYRVSAQNGGLEIDLRALAAVVDRDLISRSARLHDIGQAIVKDLTPELADDFLSFFDTVAFQDNPRWSSCYCMEEHVSPEDWNRRTAEVNRRDQEARIRNGDTRGVLAYVDGRPVGWCNAGPLTAMVGLDRFPTFKTEDAERVGSIVCFVIAPQYRRHGIARLLLDAACDLLERQGFAVAEAYPTKRVGSDAVLYRGPLPLYLDAGFETHRDGPRSVAVRKALAR